MDNKQIIFNGIEGNIQNYKLVPEDHYIFLLNQIEILKQEKESLENKLKISDNSRDELNIIIETHLKTIKILEEEKKLLEDKLATVENRLLTVEDNYNGIKKEFMDMKNNNKVKKIKIALQDFNRIDTFESQFCQEKQHKYAKIMKQLRTMRVGDCHFINIEESNNTQLVNYGRHYMYNFMNNMSNDEKQLYATLFKTDVGFIYQLILKLKPIEPINDEENYATYCTSYDEWLNE